ncbi:MULTISPECIES: GlxA family transcriptional regulator [unclassified Achromobacter]|uniref:GlxA family transcriptional regulator n=1 Tax=unclassified Achromobacter TaxID=2626865 RepID=UPI000B51D33E|nr:MULTISPECIES: GlxA family transcriptional regulator [unclassified Achromobacter]OWT80417.1 AraC family transcriptional regulator [Achromobacter sp. HZ34]OWT82300.1 AraC family transcriptional regulator [Achromobacter sp. HZ28]
MGTHRTQRESRQSLEPAQRVRDIGFLVYPEFQIQDLSGPLSAFDIASRRAGGATYRCHVVSMDGGNVVSTSGMEVVTRKIRAASYDTLIVMGGQVSHDPSQLPAMAAYLTRSMAKGTRRIASVCTGAFILAAAGLLDGRPATTHWQHAIRLQRMFPQVKVDGDRIYTRDGHIWTSAGITAGIDLALAMIEDDVGAEVAQQTARTLVVYYRRPGGQSQFSAMADLEPESDRIRTVLAYMRDHLGETLSTEKLAAVACLSPRQFGRAFLAETGETPAKAVERLRVEVARPRVERGGEPIEMIAQSVGFIDPERMRRAFVRLLGHPPRSVRRMAV